MPLSTRVSAPSLHEDLVSILETKYKSRKVFIFKIRMIIKLLKILKFIIQAYQIIRSDKYSETIPMAARVTLYCPKRLQSRQVLSDYFYSFKRSNYECGLQRQRCVVLNRPKLGECIHSDDSILEVVW